MNDVMNHDPGLCATSKEREVGTRVLCLGNDLFADDALGNLVAKQLRKVAPRDVEIISTPETGFHLLDYVLNIRRLVVVDTVVTGTSTPGTVNIFCNLELKAVPGGSPHYIGLFETLALARQLALPVAGEVIFITVEAADRLTVGGLMQPAVLAAIPGIIDIMCDLLNVNARAPSQRMRPAAEPTR